MKLLQKVNEREKKFLLIGAAVAVAILVYYAVSWYSETRKNLEEYENAKLFMIQKQINKIAEKDYIQKKYMTVRKGLERREKMLLQGNTPPVAAAAMQKFLKETAMSLNIDVKQERTLSVVDEEYYMGIPVEVGFTASTRELKDLLLKLRKSDYLLTVSELKVRVTNVSKPTDIYTTLVVTGFIKKTPKAPDKKEVRRVT